MGQEAHVTGLLYSSLSVSLSLSLSLSVTMHIHIEYILYVLYMPCLARSFVRKTRTRPFCPHSPITSSCPHIPNTFFISSIPRFEG